MRKSLFLLLLTGVLLPLTADEKKPITLDAVANARPSGDFGRGAIWAPDGQSFVFEQGGNVMLYDMKSKSSRNLFDTKSLLVMADKPPASAAFDWENRRVSSKAIQWLPNSQGLLLSLNGDLFLWDLPAAKATQLTKTPTAEEGALLSPDGKAVAFRRDHDIYKLELATKQETRLTKDGSASIWNGQLDWVYPEELDLGTAMWWSPDSQHVAYLQFDISKEPMYPHADFLAAKAQAEPQRYPQAGDANALVKLGVVSLATNKTRWMDVGDTKDALLARVDWTPDSRHVAVQRMNRVQNELKLMLSDIETGQTKTVLQETDPTWINIADDLHFFSDNKRFLWSSEKEGFRHLYLYSMDGKLQKQLTSGPWEVSSVEAVDEKRNLVFFQSTEDSPLERHLYSMKLDGTGKQKLTKGAGSHTVSVSPDGSYFLDTYSSLTQPSVRTLYRTDGSEVAVYREADKRALNEYQIQPTEIVSFKDSDGTQFYARLIKPSNFQPGRKYPAIVMVYGGPHAQSVRNSWQGINWDQALANKGFVIWQLDNRGSGGRGHQWESALYRRLGKTELDDQKKGVAHLLSMGFVDPQRIGIYGWSYGGYMTLYSMLNAPEIFKVGVAGAPVTNWRNYDTIYTERYLGLPSENPSGYADSSPVNMADKLQGKLMLVHNMEDDNVLFQNMLQMTNALQQAGKRFELQLYPQKSHGVTGKVRKQMLETMTSFFEDHLKP